MIGTWLISSLISEKTPCQLRDFRARNVIKTKNLYRKNVQKSRNNDRKNRRFSEAKGVEYFNRKDTPIK